MACTMVMSILCIFIQVLVKDIIQGQASNLIEAENYLLNLHHDHCRSPMYFNWKKLRCECPIPLQRVNELCICIDCVSEDVQQWSSEGYSEHLPEYINENFEEVFEDVEDKPEKDKNSSDPHDREEESPGTSYSNDEKRKRDFLNVEETGGSEKQIRRSTIVTPLPSSFFDVSNKHFLKNFKKATVPPWRSFRLPHAPSVNLPYFPNPSIPFFPFFQSWFFSPNSAYSQQQLFKSRRNGGFHKERSRPFGWDEDLSQTHKFNGWVPKQKINPAKMKIFKLRNKQDQAASRPQTFSNSIVAGEMQGKVESGFEKGAGIISSFRGTGALTLGAGGGTAGSAAFTGLGTSDLNIQSAGSSASGEAVIGEMAQEGSSTTSLLLGSGDAIAVNSLGGKGSSSAAGFSTSKTAGAATSAYGPASASVSATPGIGNTSSSASFSDGINTSAGVKGDNSTIVESTSVGNPHQDISNFLMAPISPFRSRKPIKFEPVGFDFSEFFNPNNNKWSKVM